MAAEIIDGRAIGARVREQVATEVAALAREGIHPGLATVLVGEDPASAVYVANKRKACAETGIADHHRHLPADVAADELVALLNELNGDPAVSGILLQLPLPPHLDGTAMIALIDPDKDVDGLTPVSAGRLSLGLPGLRSCTPAGVLELLDAYDVELEGAEAVVVGRSALVGKPIVQLLLERNATVTTCHSRTRDLAAVCRRADVLVAAAGQPRMIGADHVREGAVVIDVGLSRLPDGLAGDVDFDAASERARLITPVPGGVGPMTIAMLLRNTVAAARTQAGRSAAR
jgi:methylenetetrahydrofolate dehydrogenase (NADP+)/methenyltetrahydrofolate cyclohydrolase